MTTTRANRSPDIGPVATRVFAQFFRAYLECDEEVQAIVRRQATIATDPEIDEEDRASALATVLEALFPDDSPYDGRLGLDLADWERFAAGDDRAAIDEMDRQEATFAARLHAAMTARGMTQAQLASALGVGQPAISNLLNRESRPQSRTVARLAEALGMPPEDLWPARAPDGIGIEAVPGSRSATS